MASITCKVPQRWNLTSLFLAWRQVQAMRVATFGIIRGYDTMGEGARFMPCAEVLWYGVVPPCSATTISKYLASKYCVDGTASRALAAPRNSMSRSSGLRNHGHIKVRSMTLPLPCIDTLVVGTIPLAVRMKMLSQAPICVIFQCGRSGSRRTSTQPSKAYYVGPRQTRPGAAD